MPTPTAPSMNSGPEVLQKVSIRFASFCVIALLLPKSPMSFAPIGYPDVILTEKTNADKPGAPNSFRNGASNILPTYAGSPRTVIKLAQIKKGSNAGNTELAHKEMPFCAAFSAMAGYAIITKQPAHDNAPARI